ncbi:type I restriction enzyme HsdR N-terminal domain-containing protein [Leptobacterium sp. I13]|uniref:type I restriction enzyme HsdR N-terminal domain-containing protein n=1 Tax=Leptobacterium meishanense TaxID=3128904 RepID=UPI0030EEB337
MQNLNFPNYTFRFKNSKNTPLIFDEIRKKFITLYPEEWVRQHMVQFLIQNKGYPKSYINVEKELQVGTVKKRYDVVVYNKEGGISIVIECKAPSVTINQDTFDQIARYNLTLKADYLIVTNGLNHYYCQMDYEQEKYIFVQEIPPYIC